MSISASPHAVNGSTNLDYVRTPPTEHGWWEITTYSTPKAGEYYCVAPWDRDCPVRECEEGNYHINFSPVFIMLWVVGERDIRSRK